MDNIDQNKVFNELDVEITDLDPIDEDSKFAVIRLTAHTFFTKLPWQRVRFSVQRILLLCLILLMPLVISTSYNSSPKSSIARECVRQQLKIVYVANETITSSGTTITVVAVDAPSTLYLQKGSILSNAPKVASTTCK